MVACNAFLLTTLLLLASPARRAAAWQEPAPAAPERRAAPVAAPGQAPLRDGFEVELAVERPLLLEGGRKLEVRRRLAGSAEKLGGNVVSLTIERRIGDGMVYAFESSGLVLNQAGDVVTIGSSLEQAGRIAVYFRNAPSLRPRRATVVGVDATTDVGLLSIGSIELPPLQLAGELPAPPMVEGVPLDPLVAEQRYVVTLFGSADGASSDVSLGWLHAPLRNPVVGKRRFDQLLRVTLARSPTSGGGGVIAQQDGSVVGLLLQSPSLEGAPIGGAPLLALPATTVQRGVAAVHAARAAAAESAGAAEATPAVDAPSSAWYIAPRTWIGFGATDLAESEFLAQLGVGGAIVVQHVFEESPALVAGVEPHDVVVAWNGEPIGSVDAMLGHLARSAPGDAVQLDVVRRLERRSLTLTLGAW